MNQNVSQIWHSPSIRNVGKLLSANIFAQALSLLIYPLLTRLFTPENFGLMSLFLSISGVLVIVATAEYHYAIVLPKEEEKARSLAQLCGFIVACVVIFLCLTIPFSRGIAALFKAPELAHWWWAMPVSVAVMAVWNILNYLYIRSQSFTKISSYLISQSVVNAGAKLSFGWLGWLSGGLIIGSIVGPFCAIVWHVVAGWKQRFRQLFVINRPAVHEMAKEYRNFPCFSLPKSLVNTFSMNLPTFLLTPVFGLENVGFWSLALMVSFQPVNIIARSIYQVFYQKVAVLVQQRQSIRGVIWAYTWKMGLVMIVGLAALYGLLPWLVTTLFGAKWLVSATLIRYLYPMIGLTILSSVLCFLPDVFGRQRGAFVLEVINLALLLIALSIGIYLGEFRRSILLYSLAETLFILLQLGWFGSLVRRYEQSISDR